MTTDAGVDYAATSERLRLRKFGPTDVATIADWFNSLDLRRSYFLTEDDPPGMDALHEVISYVEANPSTQSWVMENRGSGDLVAFCSWRPDLPFVDVYEIELTLNPEVSTGRGYGTEAFQLLVDHLFRTVAPHKVFGRVAVFNEAMLAMASKKGATVEGRLREHALLAQKRVDLIIIGVLRSEWEAYIAEL